MDLISGKELTENVVNSQQMTNSVMMQCWGEVSGPTQTDVMVSLAIGCDVSYEEWCFFHH